MRVIRVLYPSNQTNTGKHSCCYVETAREADALAESRWSRVIYNIHNKTQSAFP